MIVFLCTPHITAEQRYGKLKEAGSFLPPLGLCLLGAMLEENGHQAVIVDGQLPENNHNQIVERAVQAAPGLIGISSVLLSQTQTLALARDLKARLPNVPLVVGGPLVTTVMEEGIREPAIDAAAFGEGEYTILELVEWAEGKRAIADINGVIWRQDSVFRTNPGRPSIQDLNALPLPARHLLSDLTRYSNHILVHRREPMTSMITSRGCTGKCTFCNRIFGNEYRFFSADYVLKEIDELVLRYGMAEIEIEDDTFTVDRQRVVDICQGLIARQHPLIWSCASRVTTLDFELLKLMKKAGCWMIQIGIETGDQVVMKSIKKGITLERVRQVVDWANAAKVEVKGFFMIGHHTDTAETIEKTIRFATSLKIHTANFALANPFPGTEFFKLAPQYGTFTYDPDKYSAHTETPIFVPHGLTADQLIRYKQKALRSFYLHPYRIWKFLKELTSITDAKRLYKGVKTFLRTQSS